MTLIGFELRRIVGRRGSFFGVMAVSLGIALLVFALNPSDTQTGDVWLNAIGVPLVFGAGVVGALSGSYDAAQGTMRYLVLTGVPRWKLVAIRVPALVIAILLIATPAAIVGIGAMASGGESTAGILRGVAGGITLAVIWGIVAMTVGTLLRSNGAGIAVALVLFLVSGGITAFVRAQISQSVGDYLLPNVSGVVAAFGHRPNDAPSDYSTMPYFGAVIALLLWMAAVTALAIARAERDEY